MSTHVTPVPEATHYGIDVTAIGEDGDLLAFGHHDPRHALAAFNRHARIEWGLANLADCRSACASDAIVQIATGWGRFRKPAPGTGEDPDWEWVMDECAASAEHAVPYTRYRA
jgi:hypothetical protein